MAHRPTRLVLPLVAAVALVGPAAAAAAPPRDVPGVAALERASGARIGVLALDTGTGAVVAHRGGERFAFASTAKTLVAGLTLRSAPLDARLRFSAADVAGAGFAPVTARHVASGMTVRSLLDAMLRYSDNAAANVLVRRLGGPAAVQRGLRALGDGTTRVDRTEPALNTAIPGDARDTTTPRAMVADLRRLVLGGTLTRPRRVLLQRLMLTNTTGGPLVRSGVPESWAVADKTGSGERGTRNDVAVIWPPRRKPIVLAVFTTKGTPGASADAALVAATTRAAVAALR